MTLVGKPMAKSKWVGVKLISFITEKMGPTFVCKFVLLLALPLP